MMPGDEMRRLTAFPQRSHAESGSSLMLCFTSKRCEQLSHWYSYVGIGASFLSHVSVLAAIRQVACGLYQLGEGLSKSFESSGNVCHTGGIRQSEMVVAAKRFAWDHRNVRIVQEIVSHFVRCLEHT
jgi:hypothetical protein